MDGRKELSDFAADWLQRHPSDKNALELANTLCYSFKRLEDWSAAEQWCVTAINLAEVPGADQPDGYHRKVAVSTLRSVYIQSGQSDKLEVHNTKYPPGRPVSGRTQASESTKDREE